MRLLVPLQACFPKHLPGTVYESSTEIMPFT